MPMGRCINSIHRKWRYEGLRKTRNDGFDEVIFLYECVEAADGAIANLFAARRRFRLTKGH